MNPTSGVLTEAWEYYKAHWKHLLTIALVVYAAVALIGVILTALFGVVGAILAAAVSIVGLFLLQGALVTAVADIRAASTSPSRTPSGRLSRSSDGSRVPRSSPVSESLLGLLL